MAIWYVDSAAGGTNAGTSWTNAWTAVESAFTNVTTADDVIYISHAHNETLAADTTYTISANHVLATPLKIYSVNKSNDALTAGAFVGHTSLNRSITITSADNVAIYIYGVIFQIAGSSSEHFMVLSNGRSYGVFEQCGFYLTNTSSTSKVYFGFSSSGRGVRIKFLNCTFKFGHASQGFSPNSYGTHLEFIGCSMSAGASHPSALFQANSIYATFVGCDLSTITGLTTGTNYYIRLIRLDRCAINSGLILCDPAANSLDLSRVELFDCSSGDTHYHIAYGNQFGALQVDTGIYCDDAITSTPLSWKLVSSSYATLLTPFVTPWMSVYHSGTSAITPYLEILRSGSATAFTDAEVWAEWAYKGTSGVSTATVAMDRVIPLATAANQAASSKTASNWTGENATSWFGKLGPSASITPAEVGYLSFRIYVGSPSTTVYVDPQIRGLA